MEDPLYLILDQGGHSSRALVFDATGELLVLGRRPVSTARPGPGRVEQDPEELVRSLEDAAAEAVGQLSAAQITRLAGAGLVTQRSSMICWQRCSGKALSPVLSWQDTRAADWLGGLPFDREWLRRRTGLVANAHYGASKMRWCLDNLPSVAAGAASDNLVCGPLAAFLVVALTGRESAVVDPGNGSRTLLMNCRTRDWDPSLLDLFGIPPSVLPALRPTMHDYGNLVVAGVEIPLRLVNGDQCSAFFADGDLSLKTAYINAGSGAFIARPLVDKAGAVDLDEVPRGLLQTPVFCDDQHCRFVCEGTVNGAASALDFGASMLGLPDYRELDRWSERHRQIPLFSNGIGGLGSPFWQPDFPSHFIFADAGPDNPDREAKMLAVLESVVFLLALNLELMTRDGARSERLQVSGGLAGFAAFSQRLADLTGLPVFRPEMLEATARGAAWQLMSGIGISKAGWRQAPGTAFEPRRGEAVTLRHRYESWCRYLPPLPSV